MVYGGGTRYYFKPGKMKKLKQRKDGYVTVRLYKNNKMKDIRVHRLVAYAFIHNDDWKNKNHVNHIDCVRNNNRVDNLEWCSVLENHVHSDRLGRKIKPPVLKGRSNPNSRPVITTNTKTNKTMNFDSIVDGLRFIGIDKPNSKVTNVMKSIERNGSAYGHKWKYA